MPLMRRNTDAAFEKCEGLSWEQYRSITDIHSYDLDSNPIKYEITLKAEQVLTTLAENNQVTIRWTLAQQGFEGIELVHMQKEVPTSNNNIAILIRVKVPSTHNLVNVK